MEALKLHRCFHISNVLCRFYCWYCDALLTFWFPFSSWSFTDILIVLQRLWTPQLSQEVPSIRGGIYQGTARDNNIIKYNNNTIWYDNNLMRLKAERNICFFFLAAPGNPSWDRIVFGEVLGPGLTKSQRLGEDLCHWHKSKSPIYNQNKMLNLTVFFNSAHFICFLHVCMCTRKTSDRESIAVTSVKAKEGMMRLCVQNNVIQCATKTGWH